MDKESLFNFFKTPGGIVLLLLWGGLCLGNPTIYSLDRDGDGQKEKQVFLWGGSVLRETFDSNQDQIADIWRSFKKGKPFLLTIDQNFDGKRDAWALYGEGEKLLNYHADTNFDGIIDYAARYDISEYENTQP